MSSSLQIAGTLAITAGAFLYSLPLGLIVGGVLAVFVGIAIAR